MSRFAPIITMDQFKDKVSRFFDEENSHLLNFDAFPAKIDKDLSKVNFDWENYEFREGEGLMNYPCGFKTLRNGLPVLFINAGGDWEIPICFCIYWDGKSLRAYIPKEGNVYNTKEMCAYGSEESDSFGVDIDDIKDEGDAEKIESDIMLRIVISGNTSDPNYKYVDRETPIRERRVRVKTLEELQGELQAALAVEDYLLAARLRDEIVNFIQ